MKQFIDFYMVVISPWCYLGLNRLISISKTYDIEINIKPIDLFSIFKEYGTKGVKERPLPVQKNRINEIKRWGNYLDIKINEKNKEYFNLGKKLYFKKIGQMGLSCNQCHDERVGQNLRAEKVSQGHINGFPSYLLRWSKIASVHKRIQFCNEQARAIPFKIFSKEYNALQLYMTWRGRGLKIETPAVRK